MPPVDLEELNIEVDALYAEQLGCKDNLRLAAVICHQQEQIDMLIRIVSGLVDEVWGTYINDESNPIQPSG